MMPVPDTVQIEIKLTSSTTKKTTFNELLFKKLKEEAMTNGFKIEYNDTFIN